jgi:hypothetical protein
MPGHDSVRNAFPLKKQKTKKKKKKKKKRPYLIHTCNAFDNREISFDIIHIMNGFHNSR